MNNVAPVQTNQNLASQSARQGKPTTYDAQSGDRMGENNSIEVHTNTDGSVDVITRDENGTMHSEHFTAEEAQNLVINTGTGKDNVTETGRALGNTPEPNISYEGERFSVSQAGAAVEQAPAGGEGSGQPAPAPEGGGQPAPAEGSGQPAPAEGSGQPTQNEEIPNSNTPPPTSGPEGSAAAQATPPNPYQMTKDNAIIEIDKSIAELEAYRDAHNKAYEETGKGHMAEEAGKAQLVIDKLNELKGKIAEMDPEVFVAKIQDNGEFAAEFQEVGNDLWDVKHTDDSESRDLGTLIATKKFFTPEGITSELETNVALAEQQAQAQAQSQQAPPANEGGGNPANSQAVTVGGVDYGPGTYELPNGGGTLVNNPENNGTVTLNGVQLGNGTHPIPGSDTPLTISGLPE